MQRYNHIEIYKRLCACGYKPDAAYVMTLNYVKQLKNADLSNSASFKAYASERIAKIFAK